MKNIKNLLLGIGLATLALSSCTKDPCKNVTCAVGEVCMDGTCMDTTTQSSNNVVISSNITSNTTWTSDKVYELGGRITVLNGVTLTIEAGTVIKGQAGTGANATALLIARGAKLEANGTAALPIIFTSVSDEITPANVAAGNLASPNLDANTSGLWGGLIILGRAPISASANEVQIEGIPTTDANGLYGGVDSLDNSGTITYVSIRHGGANIGNGNEINGLTLGGVGAGTTIEYIEVVGNQDDGVEFFGGTVNVKNVLILNAGDDAIDTDQAWAGTLDNFIVICGNATDHALEIDGPEGTRLAGNTLMNGSIKGNTASELADFRSSARGSFSNLFFFDFTDPAIDGRGDLSLSSGSDLTFTAGDLTFANLECVLPAGVILSAVFKNGTDVHATSVTTRTVGADKTKFTSWTWADKASLLGVF